MGNISEKLLYLNDTKQAIASAITAKGVVIPEGATFRSYANSISAIETGGEAINFAVGPVANISTAYSDATVFLKWTDPNDLVFEGNLLAEWAGTRIVRKIGSYPESEVDGMVVIDSVVRNQYSENAYSDTGLVNDTTYYYSLFPYTTKNVYTYNTESRISAKPSGYKIYGVKIDITNSNPETAVTYTDSAVGMTPGSSLWDAADIFKDIKPCLFKNGTVRYYLDPNDYTKKIDGTASSITNRNDGDVMVEFDRFAYAIYIDGTDQYVKITKNPNAKDVDSRFCYYGFTRDVEGDRNKVYISAYLCASLSSKLRSLSGQLPASVSLSNARIYARANGAGYDLIGYHQIKMLQCLFLIKYKSRDQNALGRGYSHYTNTSNCATGGTDTNGLYYGESTGKLQLKFAGIEDFVGNKYYFVDGVNTDTSRNILIASNNFNSANTGYINTGVQCPAAIFSLRFISTSELPLTASVSTNGARIMYL